MTLSDNSGVAVVVIASLFGTLFAIVWDVVVLGTLGWWLWLKRRIRLAPPEIGA
jgi:hypothetical protein